ncbi:MAG TPA: hypothetical protein VNT42_02885 [Sphingomonas sp.]|nr:hypothetical protein [Sphingomonas sp.]
MRRHINLLAAVCALVAVCAPAAAQSADQDVRCSMVASIFAKMEKDPPKRQTAAVIYYFYLGRVDARMSVAQLKSALIAQGKLMKQAEIPTVMNGCVAQLRNKELALRALAAPVNPK